MKGVLQISHTYKGKRDCSTSSFRHLIFTMPGKPFDFAERDYNISPSYEFRIDRSVYNEFQFAKKFRKSEQEDNIKAKISASLSGRKCSRGTLLGFILSLIPVLKWLPNYNLKKDLVRDIAGGLTVGIMQIPQGFLLIFSHCNALFIFL